MNPSMGCDAAPRPGGPETHQRTTIRTEVDRLVGDVLELAQEALEEAAVALLVAHDRDDHVLRRPVEAVGHLDDLR